jgi:hypothetical protein
MPKKDGATKRLEEAISRAQYDEPRIVTNDGGKTASLEYFGLLKIPPSNVLQDPHPAALMHLDAGNYLDQPVLAAFKAFGLNHRYHGHWRILLTYFASVHFAARRAPGRRRTWTDLELVFLLADFEEKKKRHPGKSDKAICGYIASDRDLDEGTVRRKLQDARKPKILKMFKSWIIAAGRCAVS